MRAFLAVLFCMVPLCAGTYWVGPSGAAAKWAACESVTPLSGIAACTIAQANTNALAGDTVYIRGGTYTFNTAIGSAIYPMHSGTCPGTCIGGVGASRIVFAAYPGETPVFQQVSSTNAMIGILLKANSWIKVTGIIFKNFTYARALFYANSSYNEISYCQFVSDPGFEVSRGFIVGQGIGTSASVHNWIHHNYFSSIHYSDPCGEHTDLVRLGQAGSQVIPKDNHNTFEYNYLEYAGHALFVSNAFYNVIANNIAHNEPFISGCMNYYTGDHTSTTSITIPSVGTTIHLVTQTGISDITLTSNQPLVIFDPLNYTHAIKGRVNQVAGGYDSNTGDLYLIVDNVAGSGTYSKWFLTQKNVPQYDNSAYKGLFGHRAFGIGDNYTDPTARRNVVEGNRIGYMSTNPGNAGDANLTLAFPYNIARYNFIYGGMDAGIFFKWVNHAPGVGGVHNYVYNNTIYGNGHGWSRVYGGFNGGYPGQGISQEGTVKNPSNNSIINNLVNNNGQGDICTGGYYGNNTCTPATYDTVINNWCTYAGSGPCSATKYGDPHFTNPDLTNTLSQNLFTSVHGYAITALPDLSLLSTSGAIDAGTYLTQAIGSGSSSTTLVVGDAGFFQDGTAGSDLARGVTFFPDWIVVGTVSNSVQISAINYSTNTIALASPLSWSNGDHVWLFKKSDGATVLAGPAPDMGAFEYGVPIAGGLSLCAGNAWARANVPVGLTWNQHGYDTVQH
jgi:hypothetical protein